MPGRRFHFRDWVGLNAAPAALRLRPRPPKDIFCRPKCRRPFPAPLTITVHDTRKKEDVTRAKHPDYLTFLAMVAKDLNRASLGRLVTTANPRLTLLFREWSSRLMLDGTLQIDLVGTHDYELRG